jgi:hypothetical protein
VPLIQRENAREMPDVLPTVLARLVKMLFKSSKLRDLTPASLMNA